MLTFLNDYKIYEVPNRFSYQHILLLLMDIIYILMISLLLKNKSKKTQKIYFLVVNFLCIGLFVGRMFFGWENARIYNQGSKTTLLPLELCNLNIFVSTFTILLNKKTLYNYSYYISMIGGLIPLIVFPDCHMITNGNNLFHYMFIDYWFIHTHLVAIPIWMIVCRWFKPSIKVIPQTLLFLFIIYTFVFTSSLVLKNFPSFEGANYMYCINDNNLPILKQLHQWIPYPYLYALPLILPVTLLFYILGIPFIKANKKEALNNA